MIKQTAKQLTEHFGIAEMLVFSENEHGAIKAAISTPTCNAEIYMQGAHLTRWQPARQKEVLFLSDRSSFQPGKAIRGGVPLIFPWFGPRNLDIDNTAPSHGFARTSNDWVLVAAGRSKDDFMMTFELSENDTSKSFGYEEFKLIYKVAVGEELELELIVENSSHEILQIEEAFHTYFNVSNVETIGLSGLENIEYLDKTDNYKRKKQTEAILRFQSETDRPYLNTESAIVIEDAEWQRKILVDKLGSRSTVIWNPWAEQTAKLSDMSPDGWQHMLCIETANINENAITVPPGSHHAMHARVRVSD